MVVKLFFAVFCPWDGHQIATVCIFLTSYPGPVVFLVRKQTGHGYELVYVIYLCTLQTIYLFLFVFRLERAGKNYI